MRTAKTTQSPRTENVNRLNRLGWVTWCVGFLTVAGFLLRAWNLGGESLWLDEGISTIYAKAILQNGYPLLPSGRVCWDSFPAHYLMAAFLWIRDDPHTAGRWVSVAAGTLSIPGLFVLARAFSGSVHGALVSTVLLAFSYYEIAWSRQARYYMLLQLMILIGIYCAYAYEKSGRRRYVVGALLAALVSVMTHRTGYLLVLFYFLMISARLPLLLAVVRRKAWSSMPRLWLIAGLSVPGLALLLWVPSHSNIGNFIARIFATSGENYILPYALFMYDELGVVLFAGLIGACLSWSRAPRKAYPLVLTSLVFFLLVALRWRYLAFRYMLPLFVPLLAFASGFFGWCIEWARKSGARIASLAACGAVLAGFHMYADRLVLRPRSAYGLDGTVPQPDWRQAYAIVQEHYQGSSCRASSELRTISAVPLFHDIYLGPETGQKYYLPISFTGIKAEVAGLDPYVQALPLLSLDALLETGGYLILDDFSMDRIDCAHTRKWVKETRPDVAIVRGGEDGVFVWFPRKPPRQGLVNFN